MSLKSWREFGKMEPGEESWGKTFRIMVILRDCVIDFERIR